MRQNFILQSLGRRQLIDTHIQERRTTRGHEYRLTEEVCPLSLRMGLPSVPVYYLLHGHTRTSSNTNLAEHRSWQTDGTDTRSLLSCFQKLKFGNPVSSLNHFVLVVELKRKEIYLPLLCPALLLLNLIAWIIQRKRGKEITSFLSFFPFILSFFLFLLWNSLVPTTVNRYVMQWLHTRSSWSPSVYPFPAFMKKTNKQTNKKEEGKLKQNCGIFSSRPYQQQQQQLALVTHWLTGVLNYVRTRLRWWWCPKQQKKEEKKTRLKPSLSARETSFSFFVNTSVCFLMNSTISAVFFLLLLLPITQGKRKKTKISQKKAFKYLT